MPRFFFDVFDGQKLWADSEGSDHADLTEAHQEAIDTLTNLSRETFALSEGGSISVEIRLDGGPAVARVTISLAILVL